MSLMTLKDGRGRVEDVERARVSGRNLRARVSRTAQGRSCPGPGRCDPVAALKAANADRVRELVPLKFYRMAQIEAASQFRLRRGWHGAGHRNPKRRVGAARHSR
jgi:hypothetical protein